MRKRQTFLLTVLTTDNGPASFCGRVKVIASGKTLNFSSLDELYRLIAKEMEEDAAQAENPLDLPLNRTERAAPAD